MQRLCTAAARVLGRGGLRGQGMEDLASRQKQGRPQEAVLAMPTLSGFRDVPPAQKLEGSLLKTYKQDDYPNKAFLAYRGSSLIVGECKTSTS